MTLHPTERARRVIAATLQNLGEHVLERDAAAATIAAALVADGHLQREDERPARYVPAVCRCLGIKQRPAVLDRDTNRHALLTSTEAAARWAARWSLPGEGPNRLHAWHPVRS